MPKKTKKSVRAPRAAKNVYLSVCHGAQATKNPLIMPDGNRVGRLGSSPKDADEQGLGGWRCSTCGKPAKVTRAAATKAAA